MKKVFMYPAEKLCGTSLASHSFAEYLYWAIMKAKIMEKGSLGNEPRRRGRLFTNTNQGEDGGEVSYQIRCW